MDEPKTSALDAPAEGTVVRPSGGPSLDSGPAPSAEVSALAALRRASSIPEEIRFAGIGVNALTDAAAQLLILAGQIRGSVDAPKVDLLRSQLVSELKAFEATARARRVDFEAVIPARYALCALLDEVVLTTPWGSVSSWSRQTLLSLFHNETWGGEKFFQMIDRAVRNPPKNLQLLELLYLCLAHGFKGRYRVTPDGDSQLELVRDNLYRVIRSQRQALPPELSPHWKPSPVEARPMRTLLPLWLFAVVALVGLAVLFSIFDFRLYREASPVFEQLNRLGRAPPPPVERFGPLPAPPHPAIDMLQPDVDAGRLVLIEQPDRLVIRVTVADLFGSARTRINDPYLALFNRIAEYLGKVSGKVQVIGYTDNLPIRSRQFPSNEALSKARADAVAQVLRNRGVAADRIAVIGRGAADPIAPNDSPANRARNRRVEISVERRTQAKAGAQGGG